MNDVVSVVLPVYKTEKYLDRCIKSVVMQSYRHLEIIIVDDGSPDGCPQKCDEWAQKDPRIKVIHKENAGLGMARNTGIECATGKYICFFDSDDYISTDLVERCYDAAERLGADMVCFGHDLRTPDGDVIDVRIPSFDKELFVGEDILDELLAVSLSLDGENANALGLSAWGKFYSMETVRRHGWRFVSEREIISEDFYSLTEFFFYVKRVAVLDRALYHYTVNTDSLSHSYRKDRYGKLKEFSEAMKALSVRMGHENELREPIASSFVNLSIGAMKHVVGSRMGQVDKRRELRDIVDDPYLQDALRCVDRSRGGVQKKLLFTAIGKGWVSLVYFLVALKQSVHIRIRTKR